MNCPSCGAIMVWLNGSVLHDPPIKEYECRSCRLLVIKYPDGNYESTPMSPESQQQSRR